MAEPHATVNPPQFLLGCGEMADHMRAFDWTATALGAPSDWPVTLRTLVNPLLSTQPMFVAWRPAQIWLCKDAFTPILGTKHPGALGRPAMGVWAEGRDVLAPLFDRVFRGEAVSLEGSSLPLDRRGVLEDAYFNFSYTPIQGDDATAQGRFGACIETTERV
jgi:hypothetical protein